MYELFAYFQAPLSCVLCFIKGPTIGILTGVFISEAAGRRQTSQFARLLSGPSGCSPRSGQRRTVRRVDATVRRLRQSSAAAAISSGRPQTPIACCSRPGQSEESGGHSGHQQLLQPSSAVLSRPQPPAIAPSRRLAPSARYVNSDLSPGSVIAGELNSSGDEGEE